MSLEPQADEPPTESDSRFPSGPWEGYYLQPPAKDRRGMELLLNFRQGEVHGVGRDPIGEFLIRGRYEVESGRCWWSKRYVGRHDVAYQGFNEGKGIWGTWEIPVHWKGGFHIWPVGMGDPGGGVLAESVEPPVTVEVAEGEPALASATLVPNGPHD